MTPSIEEVIQLAMDAGEILRAGFGKQHQITMKSEIDPVTEVDRQSEAFLVSRIRANHPGDLIIGEESGVHGAGSRPDAGQWIIDPLDGTVNYSHGLPIFAVSIAFARNGRVELGVVYDPMQNECFSAEHGKGAYLNGKRINVSKTDKMIRSLLCTGFAYDVQTARANNLDYFSAFTLKSQAVRRLGSAALDLCYVAAGRLDGFWELSLNAWDVAAGILLVEEAGGIATDIAGNATVLKPPYSILAANPHIHPQMLAILNEAGNTE